jgi:hypothetical protein
MEEARVRGQQLLAWWLEDGSPPTPSPSSSPSSSYYSSSATSEAPLFAPSPDDALLIRQVEKSEVLEEHSQTTRLAGGTFKIFGIKPDWALTRHWVKSVLLNQWTPPETLPIRLRTRYKSLEGVATPESPYMEVVATHFLNHHTARLEHVKLKCRASLSKIPIVCPVNNFP